MAGMRVVRGGASQGGAVPLYPLRPMPFEQATAWGPALTGDARPSRPEAPGQIFLTPDVLRAVAWHTTARRDGGSAGFFVGRRLVDPDTREPWVLVDAVIPIDRPVARELPGRLVEETIDRASEEARTSLRYLVGWYHSHHARQPVLTAAAMETHERHFANELHAFVMVVTVGHAEPQGAVFRPGVERGPVPFYELFEDVAELAKHPRPTALQWRNYFTVETVKREVTGRRSNSLWDPVTPPSARPGADAPAPEPRDAAPLLIHPSSPAPAPGSSEALPRRSSGKLALLLEEDVTALLEPRQWLKRRPLLVAAVAVASVLALIGFVRAQRTTPAPALTPAPEVSATVPTALDSAAQGATVAVRAYRDLAVLFDRRQVGCDRLRPALVSVEERWMAYTVAKSGHGRPLDAPALERERALDAGVRGAEQHFQGSGCPRP